MDKEIVIKTVSSKIMKTIENHLGEMLELDYLNIDEATCSMSGESVILKIKGFKPVSYTINITEIKEN
ncbi:hypothetical protein [Clostridium sp.]